MRAVASPTLLVLAVALGLTACRSPRLGATGDTCGRTDDCEAPLRCLDAVCRDALPGLAGKPLPRTADTPRPRGALPPLNAASTESVSPAAGVPAAGQLPTQPPDEAAVPAAGLPGQH